ncbi:MAG: hypothetical protein WA949_04745, partial [Phormidesmis sp.]
MLKQPLILRLLKSRRAIQPAADNAPTVVITKAATAEKLVTDTVSSNTVSSKPDLTSDKPEAELKPRLKPRLKLAEWLTVRRLFIGFGVLAGLTGLAFTRDWPTAIQTQLQPDPAKIPLHKAGDPQVDSTAEATGNVADLFLTHQIFYRKLEAISGAAIAPTPTSKDKPVTSATDAKAATAKPTVEKVTAAAPPAPDVKPTDFSGTTIDSVLEMRVAVAKDVSAIGFATSQGGTLA